MGFKSIFLWVCLLITIQSPAQNLVYKFLTIKEGLPTNNIFKIKFDKKGFLWVAHDNGISRYDGYTFKHYISPYQKSNVYTDLLVGPDGKIWMTNLGLQVFYIENDEMVLFKSFNLNFPPSTLKINFLDNGNLIVNAEGGLFEFDLKKKTERKITLNITIQNFAVHLNSVYFNNPSNEKLYKYTQGRLDTFDIGLPFSVIYGNDSCVISSYNVSNELLIRYGKGYKKTKILPLSANYNHSEIIGHYFYVFTTQHVSRINLKNGEYALETKMDGRSYTHYTKDKLGNEWYSTLNEGIIIKPASNIQLVEVGEKSPFIRLVQFNEYAYGITVDNQLFRMNENSLEYIANYNEYLGNKPIILAKNLNNQYLLLGNSRFLLIDSGMKSRPYFQQLAMKDASLHENGKIYLATTGNIFYHPFKDNSIDYLSNRLSFKTNDSTIKRVNMVGRFYCVKYDQFNQTLYFGGVPGLFSIKEGQEAIEVKDGDKQIFSSFLDFSNPYLIIGTIQSGIYILKNGKIYRNFNAYNSTLGNTVLKIKLYQNKIWVLSNKGIHTIDLNDFNIQTYSYIGAVELNKNNDFTLAKDILYLISGQKTYKVKLSELRKRPPVIPIFFNYVEVGDKKIFQTDKLTFNYDENSFAIGLDVPAASVLGNVDYEFRINNNNWFQLNKGQNKIYLNQLAPGNYKLFVRQIGIPTTYSLSFIIRSPFWKQWWFFTLIAILLAGSIIFVYINRVNTIRQKTQSEIEKFKLEKALQLNVLSSIRSQMNPHFLFNALNTIQSYIYLNDKKQAINYLGKFSVLTRKILEESNRETISLGEEMETLDLYLQLEKMRFENILEYSIELDGIKYPEQFKVPPMLIQPYVENAVKHGLMHKPSNRKLKVVFKYNEAEKLIQVNIDDNGIGRRRSEEINSKRNSTHRSFSTKANKTRLDILNSDRSNPISVQITDKTDEYDNPLGTLVQINIPVL